MNDCLWASAAMLIDKWTNGKIHPTHQRLRALSGDRVRRLELRRPQDRDPQARASTSSSPPTAARGSRSTASSGGSPTARAPSSWATTRELPRWYGRWDYGFWKMTKKDRKKHPSRDNHAVYVERFDRRHGRVWLMDPLGRAGWKGEWISIWSLRRFAWSSGGALFAAVTPNAKPAPFAHVRTERRDADPDVGRARGELVVPGAAEVALPGRVHEDRRSASRATRWSRPRRRPPSASASPTRAARSHTVVASAATLAHGEGAAAEQGRRVLRVDQAHRPPLRPDGRPGRRACPCSSRDRATPRSRCGRDEAAAEAGKAFEASVSVENTRRADLGRDARPTPTIRIPRLATRASSRAGSRSTSTSSWARGPARTAPPAPPSCRRR